MKTTGSILLAVGFLVGAYVSVAHEKHVDWMHFGLCAASMLVGMILLRIARANETARAAKSHEGTLDTLEKSLTTLLDKIYGFESASSDEEQLGMHTRIDAELMGDINTFVEARESMIPRLGMQTYANIMSPFAIGERLLNRAWSASADGYVDEVKDCIRGARIKIQRAKQLLEQARK